MKVERAGIMAAKEDGDGLMEWTGA